MATRDAGWARVYFDATPLEPPARLRPALRLRRRLGHLPVARLCRAGDHAPIPRGPRRAAPPRPAPDSQGLRRGGAPSPRPTKVFETPNDLKDAYRAGDLRPFEGIRGMRTGPPDGRAGRAGWTPIRSSTAGCGRGPTSSPPYLAAGVREVGHTRASLTVTSTVRDQRYQRLLERNNPFATREYSLHTTGYAFDVRRDVRESPAGRGIPVHARPPPVAQPDRVGARARARSTSPAIEART